MANSFFKNGDKAYSENLNDSILVGNAFDWTVEVSLPSDTGSVFPNSSTVVKAKVADLSITPNSNLSIGSTISNSSGSSQVYRLTVYPNFNRFGGFKSITLEGDGTFYIANKGGTSPIASNLDYDDLSNVPELKVLKEYDIVLTIPTGKSVSGLSFVLQSTSADVSGEISHSNIDGLFNAIYPVGSIYMSVNTTSPSVLFGGTWEKIKDRFLLASGTSYSNGATGGEATHTLTSAETGLKSHSHNFTQPYIDLGSHYHGVSSSGESFVTSENDTANNTRVTYSSSGTRYVDAMSTNSTPFHHRGYTDTRNLGRKDAIGGEVQTKTGENATSSHNNMPPYLVVNVWKRTA